MTYTRRSFSYCTFKNLNLILCPFTQSTAQSGKVKQSERLFKCRQEKCSQINSNSIFLWLVHVVSFRMLIHLFFSHPRLVFRWESILFMDTSFYIAKTIFADKPICRSEQKRIYGVARNEAAEILCEVDAFPPPESFKWSFNNTAETFEMPQSDYRIHSSQASTLSYTPVKVSYETESGSLGFGMGDGTFSVRQGSVFATCGWQGQQQSLNT